MKRYIIGANRAVTSNQNRRYISSVVGIANDKNWNVMVELLITRIDQACQLSIKSIKLEN